MNTDLKLINLSPADLVDLSEAIQEFNEALPGWRLALSHVDQRGSALCVPEENGPDAKLRLEADKRFSRGFILGLSPDSAAQCVRMVTASAVLARQAVMERPLVAPTTEGASKGLHVSFDDWEAFYLDGELIAETKYSINFPGLAKLLEGRAFTLETADASLALIAYMIENGCFPQRLSDLPPDETPAASVSR